MWWGHPQKVCEGQSHGPGRGQCQVWSGSILQFGRRMETSRQTDRQADPPTRQKLLTVTNPFKGVGTGCGR